MIFWSALIYLIHIVLSTSTVDERDKYVSGDNTDQEAALQFLQDYNHKSLIMENKVGLANWKYESNLTDENKEEMLKMSKEAADFKKEAWIKATSFAWKDFEDTNKTAYRMFKKLSILGNAILPEEKFQELVEVIADMEDIYGKAKVCAYNSSSDEPCSLSLEPELTEILASSRNYDELTHIWSEWRDATGKKIKDKFLRYVELSNEVAELNGFSDAGDLWIEAYESEDFQMDVEDLWLALRPFYEHLHAYVRQKLRKQYPLSGIKANGPIPAHILGNMWGQTWSNIFDIVIPYPQKESTDVSETMKQKKIKPLDMFKISEEFFTSLGLIKMTPEFWNRSIIEKPNDIEMVCHPSAWDFHDGKDFRIKMCTRVTLEELITVHHEMGHVEYYQQYAKQPAIFQNGANPGFHEAIGDTMALSAATPEHLQKIGLLEEVIDDEEADINALLLTALDKIAFIPFGYLIDAWRWKVFDGSFNKEELNQKWWDMRLLYQGLCPPVRRTDEDFDAAAKYHVAADVPYIRYFVSFVIQFQFHKALCDAAGHDGPLHKCDIYNNKEAGKLLSKMLSKGSSEHWEEAMNIVTKGSSRKMDAAPMIEYFTPLIDWLEEQNKDEILGWESSDPLICP